MRNFCFTSVLYVAKHFDDLRINHTSKQQQFRLSSFRCKEWKLLKQKAVKCQPKKTEHKQKQKNADEISCKLKKFKKNKWCDIMVSDRMQIMNEPFLRIFIP